jgi:2-polyprenyl-3-methyl-5-hydroxy-6-metoxy-1,4-benzoquinol methylase
MKNSYDLERQIDAKYQSILDYDKKEIDNPDKYHPSRLHYLDRIRTILSIVQRKFPVPDQVKIGDFACAQGNVALLLAEIGYKVVAIDINNTYIEYSKKKYEKGDISWMVGNVDNLGLSQNSFDIAIVGELIEHCAYPEEIIEKVLSCVKPGGYLILTTPNGALIKTKLPTFRQVRAKEARRLLMERQFGPSGEDHLFLFRLEEIDYIVPKKARIMELGYLGGSILVNKYSYHFLKLFPIRLVDYFIRSLSKVPLINKKTFINIYAILVKESCSA